MIESQFTVQSGGRKEGALLARIQGANVYSRYPFLHIIVRIRMWPHHTFKCKLTDKP